MKLSKLKNPGLERDGDLCIYVDFGVDFQKKHYFTYYFQNKQFKQSVYTLRFKYAHRVLVVSSHDKKIDKSVFDHLRFYENF